MSKINIDKAITEEGWVIQLSLGPAGMEIPLDEAQELVKDIINELKEIMEIEDTTGSDA